MTDPIAAGGPAPDAPWWVLHVDLDQFLAAVEVLRRPELAGRPVVVGGDGDPLRARQVVSTASYEARVFGVHSGMPLRSAARKCPDAVFLPVDRPVYEAASEEVMRTLRGFPVEVEVWGWDEAFVGARTRDPDALARAIRQAVLDRTQLSCAVGIGDTKLTAKTATGFAKPGGVATLTRPEWLTVMGAKPTDAIWGIGSRIAARLHALEIDTVAELAGADWDRLAGAFGPRTGPWIASLGRGGADTEVSSTPWVAKGRSRETTYPADLVDRDEIAAEVRTLAEQVTRDVVAEQRIVTRVALKLRTAAFFTRTRISKLPEPTVDPAVVAARAVELLEKFPLDRPVRLLGVRVELAPPEEPADPD